MLNAYLHKGKQDLTNANGKGLISQSLGSL